MLLFISLLLPTILGMILGYYARGINNRMDTLIDEFTERAVGPETPRVEAVAKPTVTMVDGDDPVLTAKYETDEMHRKLNPHLYPNDEDR